MYGKRDAGRSGSDFNWRADRVYREIFFPTQPKSSDKRNKTK
jgi:hypothetical protein